MIQDQLLPVVDLPETSDLHLLTEALSAWISHWMDRDMSRVLQLLYRVDVSEKTIAAWLASHQDEDSAKGLAELVVSRQLEKIQLRREHTPAAKPTDEDLW